MKLAATTRAARRAAAPCLLLAAATLGAQAVTVTTDDVNGDDRPDTWFEHHRGRIVSFRADRDFDGVVDHHIRYDGAGRKEFEEFDFDYDEAMDDFYYFTDGVLERQEIDSNFDGAIDTWVFLDSGIYISRYERDLDHDGIVDQVRDFGDAAVAGDPATASPPAN